MTGLKFAEIAKKNARKFEVEEEEFVPQQQDTENYKLGVIYQALNSTWGARASDKVREKLEQSERWDLPYELFKNVHCSFMHDSENEGAKNKSYLCKVTFSWVFTLDPLDPKSEEKETNKYIKYFPQLTKFMKQDAEDAVGKVNVTFSDITKKQTGADAYLDTKMGNITPVAKASLGTQIPAPIGVKKLMTLTKWYKITIK